MKSTQVRGQQQQPVVLSGKESHSICNPDHVEPDSNALTQIVVWKPTSHLLWTRRQNYTNTKLELNLHQDFLSLSFGRNNVQYLQHV